jgi:hypothetical protein
MMVTKKTSEKVATKSRVKVGKLQLKKQTIKDLTPGNQKQIKGGGAANYHMPPPTSGHITCG